MKPIQEDDRLPDLLRTWQVEPSHTPDFSTGVWKCIGSRRSEDSWAGFVRGHPAMLATLMLFATVVGAWGGAEFARARVQNQSAAMADAYVQALDARQMNMP